MAGTALPAGFRRERGTSAPSRTSGGGARTGADSVGRGLSQGPTGLRSGRGTHKGWGSPLWALPGRDRGWGVPVGGVGGAVAVGRGRGVALPGNGRGLGWARRGLCTPRGISIRASTRSGGFGGAGGFHPPAGRAPAPPNSRSRVGARGGGRRLRSRLGVWAQGQGKRGAAAAAAWGRGSHEGRRPGPAEPWRPRSRRRGGAGSGSGRMRARTRATSWRRARAAAGRSGGSRWAPRGGGGGRARRGWSPPTSSGGVEKATRGPGSAGQARRPEIFLRPRAGSPLIGRPLDPFGLVTTPC